MSATDRVGGRFLLLSAATGVAVGLGTAALIEVLRLFETSVLGEAAGKGSFWVFVLVPIGFFIAWATARYIAPEVAGDGVPEAIASLTVRGGLIRGRVAPFKVLATAFTVGLGGSAGREGPIVLVGASLGSKLARTFHLGEDQVISLVAAGAGAGIGATFNAPIAGMLFALEVILSSFAVRHMSAIVVASVAAAITTRSLIHENFTLSPDKFDQPDYRELILYVALALVIVVTAVLFLKILRRVEEYFHEGNRARSWARPVSMGLLTAGLLFLEPAILGTGQARLAGTGQAVTNGLLATATGATTPVGGLSQLWWVLGLLALGKILATSFTLGSGGSGGAFMPSLFIGAMVGTAFAKLIGPFWHLTALQTGPYAVVGMAAMFAAMARAPLTAILLVFEVTGTKEYGLIVPLMLTAILATFLTERFSKESVYTMPLALRGISPTKHGEVDIMDTISVSNVMAPPRLVVNPDTPLEELIDRLDSFRAHGAPVVDDAGELVGIVSITDATTSADPSIDAVKSVMTRRPVTVTPSTPVSHAMERMAALGIGRLPVVSNDDPTKLVGMFRREDAVRAYHLALGSRTDHNLQRARLDQRTDPGASYFDFRVPSGSIADGRAVREVRWPEGSTLVSVRRGTEVLVPVGDTVLVAGDLVTAFGSESSRKAMIERLNAGADEPTAEIETMVVEAGAGGGPSSIGEATDSGEESC